MKHLIVIGKAFGFLILWGITLSVMAIPAVREPSFLNGNAALMRFWWELIPLLGILLATGIFVCIVEKNCIKIPILNLARNAIIGFVLGCGWLGADAAWRIGGWSG